MLINPVVELIGEDRALGWEGCLSIPGLRAAVPRATRIRYSGVDCDGNATEREATGFHALSRRPLIRCSRKRISHSYYGRV